MNTLEQLLVEELRDIYGAEKQLVKALPKLAGGASRRELRDVIDGHLALTKTQVERLEAIFERLNVQPNAKPCKGMEGIIDEGAELLRQEPNMFRDLQLIGAAQRAEHYEVAAYGTARAVAEQLGNAPVAKALDQLLHEEAQADETLTRVAEQFYREMEEDMLTTQAAGL